MSFFSNRYSVARLIDRLKWSAEKYIMHNVLLYFYAKKLFHLAPFFLPHERDYFGLELLLRRGDGLFLDIGANDGVSALSFRRINSSYAILSLEPNVLHRKSLERVKRRIQGFDFRLCAAGDETGSTTLTMPVIRGIPFHSASFCLPEQRQVLETALPSRVVRRMKYVTQPVTVVRVDDLHVTPTVVKIDAEGYDLKILLGMPDTIRLCRPIFMIENNPSTISAVIDLLGKHGYAVYEYNHGNHRFLPYAGKPTRNVFFTTEEHMAVSGL